MRKNIAKVITAFKAGKAVQGDSKRTCWTDGHNLYSYNMLIAKRFDWLDFGKEDRPKELFVVIDRKYGPSKTTRMHIDEVLGEFPYAQIVSENSVLTWDFKF